MLSEETALELELLELLELENKDDSLRSESELDDFVSFTCFEEDEE